MAASHRLRALWVIYLSLGLRRCEALGRQYAGPGVHHASRPADRTEHDQPFAQRAGGTAGLRPLHLRTLRHSCATFLKAEGADLLVIRDILGHSQLSVTAGIYTHVLAPQLRDAIRLMDGLMDGDTTRPLGTSGDVWPLVSKIGVGMRKEPVSINCLPALTWCARRDSNPQPFDP